MKILHIVPSYKPAYIYGGPIESVSRLCEGLVSEGNIVDVITTTANGDSELNVKSGEPINVDGVTVTYFKRITTDPTHMSPDLWKFLWFNVKKYDIVHIHSWWSILIILAISICVKKGAKVVLSPRGMLSSYILDSGQKFIKNVIHTTIGKRLLKKTWFHSTAKSEYKECKSLIKGWEGFVAPNVIALPETLIEKAENDIFTIIFMSRIHPKKGLELLFDAIARLDFPVRLKIAGTGNQEYVNKLKSLVSDLGIQSQVEWLGWVDREDKFKLLMRSDLFALISYNENFANVVIESLHVGTPVLVSYGVALSEFVSQYDMGWVTSLDIETVVSTIKAAYFDEAKRSVINNTASALIAKQFATKTVIRSYISNYQKIIDSSDDPHYHFNTKPLPIEDNL